MSHKPSVKGLRTMFLKGDFDNNIKTGELARAKRKAMKALPALPKRKPKLAPLPKK